MADQPRARLGPVPVLGLALLLMTVALAGGAYQLYQRGLPGTPRVEDGLRAGVARIPRSRIAVLMPEGVRTSTVVAYHLGPDDTAGRTARLTMTITAPRDELYAGLLLGGDAAADPMAVRQEYEDGTEIVKKIDTRTRSGPRWPRSTTSNWSSSI